MDKITNNISSHIHKNEVKDTNKPVNDLKNASSKSNDVSGLDVVNIKETKKLVSEMAKSAPIDVDKVAKIKEAISSGNYPLDMDKLSDALMQAYREMKS